ncbi:MAG: hypothetical protein AABX37_02885, partial [Nanoarchaeota archaeon]
AYALLSEYKHTPRMTTAPGVEVTTTIGQLDNARVLSYRVNDQGEICAIIELPHQTRVEPSTVDVRRETNRYGNEKVLR